MIGYKIASSDGKRVLVKLRINSHNTNINRYTIKDKLCAKYRCYHAIVINIEDEKGNKYSSAFTSMYKEKSLKYILGEEVVEKDYNKDINVVCGEGIHFFLSKEVALLYGLNNVKNGEYKSWFDDGQLSIHCNYKEGKLKGEYKRWFSNCQLQNHCYYKEGKLEEEYKRWWSNGQLQNHCYYKEGKLEGEYKRWWSNGQLEIHCYYKEGKLEGEYKSWFYNGQLYIHCYYKEGKKE